jgi:type IX secretion system PorP/SprF family membrane protein
MTEFSFIYRSQWTGLKSSENNLSGVPVTQFFMAETKLNSVNSGIGIYLVNDLLGAQRSLSPKLNYSYQIKLTSDKTLALGIGLGFYNLSYDRSLLVTNNPNDPRLSDANNLNKTVLDLNTGLFYNTQKYFLGISLFHFNKPQLSSSQSYLTRTFYLTGGYNYVLNNLFTITPSVLIQSNLQAASTTFNFRAFLSYNKQQLFGGLTFRPGDALGILVGVSLLKNSNLKISYAFDVTYLGLNAKSGTSNEIYLSYSYPISGLIPKPIIRTPRYRF